MTAVVVVPLELVDDHRARAWSYVSDRLTADGWPIVAGSHDRQCGAPWVKADAVRTTIDDVRPEIRPGDVLVVHDADVLVDLFALRAAIHAVEMGVARWAIPHTYVYRLTEPATALQVSSPAPASLGSIVDCHPNTLRAPYIGIEGGGVVVLQRATYDAIPLDRRFVGWGDEDQSWGWALQTLAGEPWRSTAPLVHLWHPHAAPGQQRSPRAESAKLRRAYRAYRRHPDHMRDLVSKGR